MVTNENITLCNEMETIIPATAALITRQAKQWRLLLILQYS